MDWVGWFDAHDYEIARQVLQRGVGALAFVAFLSTLNQFRPLLGEHGLLPVPELLRRASRLRGPSLFRWGYSDRRLIPSCFAVAALLPRFCRNTRAICSRCAVDMSDDSSPCEPFPPAPNPNAPSAAAS